MASFTLRISDHLKRQIKRHAATEDASMNAWINQSLTEAAFREEPDLDATNTSRFDSIENMVGYCAACIEDNCDTNDAKFSEWNDAEHAAEIYLDHLPLKPTVPKIALDRINDILCGMKIAEQFYKNKVE